MIVSQMNLRGIIEAFSQNLPEDTEERYEKLTLIPDHNSNRGFYDIHTDSKVIP
jgi:hypothetical protein